MHLDISDKVFKADAYNYQSKIASSYESFLLMFYSTKERFTEGNLADSVKLLNQLATELEGKIRVAIMNVDDERAKRFAQTYGAWPLPCYIYLPSNSKDEEYISVYAGEKSLPQIIGWVQEKIEEDANNFQIILQPQDFQWQVEESEDAWVIMFYTNKKMWCR